MADITNKNAVFSYFTNIVNEYKNIDMFSLYWESLRYYNFSAAETVHILCSGLQFQHILRKTNHTKSNELLAFIGHKKPPLERKIIQKLQSGEDLDIKTHINLLKTYKTAGLQIPEPLRKELAAQEQRHKKQENFDTEKFLAILNAKTIELNRQEQRIWENSAIHLIPEMDQDILLKIGRKCAQIKSQPSADFLEAWTARAIETLPHKEKPEQTGWSAAELSEGLIIFTQTDTRPSTEFLEAWKAHTQYLIENSEDTAVYMARALYQTATLDAQGVPDLLSTARNLYRKILPSYRLNTFDDLREKSTQRRYAVACKYFGFPYKGETPSEKPALSAHLTETLVQVFNTTSFLQRRYESDNRPSPLNLVSFASKVFGKKSVHFAPIRPSEMIYKGGAENNKLFFDGIRGSTHLGHALFIKERPKDTILRIPAESLQKLATNNNLAKTVFKIVARAEHEKPGIYNIFVLSEETEPKLVFTPA